MHLLVTTRTAMATQFDLALYGPSLTDLQAVAEEALDEITRLDSQLNVHRDSSEMSRLNALAAIRPVKVEPTLFRLLLRCQQLYRDTEGTFDISIGALLECWGFWQGSGSEPTASAWARARECSGMHLVELNEAESTVRFSCPGVKLDLGAIGKGFAVEQAVQLLRENGIRSGIVNGGTSTIQAIGRPPQGGCWQVAIGNQLSINEMHQAERPGSSPDRLPSSPYGTIGLVDEALSVSSITGKFFTANDTILGHILAPRQGRPVLGVEIAAIASASATESDALSTALLVSGTDGWPNFLALKKGLRALVAGRDPEGKRYCRYTPGLLSRFAPPSSTTGSKGE
jgi:FAD:protein FMN transferase